jgi:pimeloyl-ACP methyl ester carboxylesterase
MQSKTRLYVLAVACLALTGCGSDDNTAVATATAPVFEASACEMTLPDGQDPAHVTCGFVTVPENRSRSDSRKVKLAVAVLHATGPSPAADPIIHLGPGLGPLLDSLMQAFTADFAAPLQSSRDLVFIDQRGTGRSTPSLACPEVATLNDAWAVVRTAEADNAFLKQELLACHDRLVAEGVDLGGYTTASLAADARDVLRALGYTRWNLYGWSQSTRIAQLLMRDSPPGEIRSVVLDSPIPISRPHIAESAAHTERALELLVADCIADVTCKPAFPNLESTIFGLLPALNASPITVEPTDPSTGESFRVVYTGDRLATSFSVALADTRFIALVPLLARQISQRRLGFFTMVLSQFAGYTFGDALGESVVCQDQYPMITAEVLARANEGINPDLARPLAIGLVDHCRYWSGITPIAGPPAPVVSEIPTLLLAGQYDPTTPPEYAHELAVTLHRSTVVEFRGHGHGQLYVADGPPGQPTCAMSVTAQHFADPERPVDASCAAALPPPHFFGT